MRPCLITVTMDNRHDNISVIAMRPRNRYSSERKSKQPAAEIQINCAYFFVSQHDIARKAEIEIVTCQHQLLHRNCTISEF